MNAHFNLSVRSSDLADFMEFQELYKDNSSRKIVELVKEHMAAEKKKQKRVTND